MARSMVIEGIAALIFGICVLAGVHRGAFATGFGLAKLFVVNGAGLLGGLYGGPLVAALYPVPPLAAGPIAGLVAFVLAAIVMAVLRRVLAPAPPEADEDGVRPGRSIGDRALGGLLGAAQGGLFVLLIGWGAGFVLAAGHALGGGSTASLPARTTTAGPAAVHPLVTTSQDAVEALLAHGAESERDPSRIAARWLARPGESLEAMAATLANPRFIALQEDSDFWRALEAGDAGSAARRPALLALAADEPLRHQLARMGVVADEDAQDVVRFERALRGALDAIAPRIRGLAEDPELQRLLEDPEVRSALERGRAWSLLMHPGVRNLASRLAAAHG